MDLKPQIWGPHYWFFLHTAAFNYPVHPNAITKKKFYELIMNLPLFIPHSKSSSDFCKLLDDYPLKPYLDSRKDLTKWVHYIHNRLNEKLNLPQKDYKKFEAEYFAQYKEDESEHMKQTRGSSSAFFSLFDFKVRDLVYFLILVALGGTIYYSRRHSYKF